MKDLYKKILIYSLAFLVGIAISGIIALITRLIIKKNPNLLNYKRNKMEPISGTGAVIAGLIIGGLALSATAGFAAYGIIKYQEGKKHMHDINEYNEETNLPEIQNDINIQLKRLAQEFDTVQKVRKKYFEKVLEIKNFERERTAAVCQNHEERQKRELDGFDRFVNKIDVLDLFKSKEQKVQEAQNDKKPNLSRIKKNEEYIKSIDEQIKGIRNAEKEQTKELQKYLDTLKERYDSIKEHIQFYEQKRGELIESGYIPENTPSFAFKTPNYRRVMEASFSLLHECSDDQGKPSAEIVAGFIKVMDQTIDQERNRYLVEDGRSYAFTMKAEEMQLKKLEESAHTQFPTFGNTINLDTPPKNYDDKKTILFCSKKQIESAEKYLKDNHKKINIDGPMRVIRQANLAIECQKLEEIEAGDDSVMRGAKELKNSSMMMLNKLNEALVNRNR